MRCIADTTARPVSGGIPTDSPYHLREFEARDIPDLTAIVEDSLHERYEASLYLSLSQQWPEGFLVAVDRDERPVGFLLGVNQVEREARILMFAVDRHRRTKGLGTRLMQTFLERCVQRGMKRITLEVRVSNATAIRFYSQFRFSVTDLLRSYYSDGENGYQMARELG